MMHPISPNKQRIGVPLNFDLDEVLLPYEEHEMPGINYLGRAPSLDEIEGSAEVDDTFYQHYFTK